MSNLALLKYSFGLLYRLCNLAFKGKALGENLSPGSINIKESTGENIIWDYYYILQCHFSARIASACFEDNYKLS